MNKARLLGVVIDDRLSFKPELVRIAESLPSCTSQVYNHIDWINGLSVARLIEKYHIWVEPRIAYGSAIWIFSIFPEIRLGAKPQHGYGDYWESIHTKFRSLMRCTTGVSKSVNFNAVLVRFGELPLHYALALQALSKYYRIQSERTGDAMSNLLYNFQSDNTRWNTTRFLAPAQRNLTYFQQFSEPNLLESGSSECFTGRLRQAMFNELT